MSLNPEPQVGGDGRIETPAQVEARLHEAFSRLQRIVIVFLVVLTVGNATGLTINYIRARENQGILRTLRANNGPEAAAVDQLSREVNRYQIDCDGQKREENSDNAIISIVAKFVPGLRTEPPVELAKDAESCKALPEKQKELERARNRLAEVRGKAGP